MESPAAILWDFVDLRPVTLPRCGRACC